MDSSEELAESSSKTIPQTSMREISSISLEEDKFCKIHTIIHMLL